MEQNERRRFLIDYLLSERPELRRIPVPEETEEQRRLLRGLVNLRPARAIGAEFLRVQDEYLAEELRERGVVRLDELTPLREGVYLWQGDITRLAVDAIVNAANSGLTGCYQPNHNCIDNCIHTYSGVQLRQKCAEIMQKQGCEEPPGRAKLTPAYNLPASCVLHTVGPIIYDEVTDRDEELLRSCYRSCLELAAENGLKSVAFCCISTGVFRFPNKKAAKIAVKTVTDYLRENPEMRVVFDVFRDLDYRLYRELLG